MQITDVRVRKVTKEGKMKAVVSITMLLHPILMTILAYPILGEKVVPIQLIGGLITLIGVIFVNLEKSADADTAEA